VPQIDPLSPPQLAELREKAKVIQFGRVIFASSTLSS